MVSSVIGSAGVGDPASPGSPSSLREPKAWRKTIVPACPIWTTAPGIRCAAMASFTNCETGANSGAGATAGGLDGGGDDAGAVVDCAVVGDVLTGVGGASRLHAGSAAMVSTTVPRA